jgi:predicted RNase H-like HicB family nuclease
MRYAIVIEGTQGNYPAYVPDLPGYVTAGENRVEMMRSMEQAIRFHLDGLREDGLPIPAPQSQIEYVEV